MVYLHTYDFLVRNCSHTGGHANVCECTYDHDHIKSIPSFYHAQPPCCESSSHDSLSFLGRTWSGNRTKSPCLRNRRLAVGEDNAYCLTRMPLVGLAAAKEIVLSQYFQTFFKYMLSLLALVKTTAGSGGI